MVNQEIYSFSIVLVGDFNPVILQPYWLANKNLIREQEASTSKVTLVHPELSRIDLDWANIEVSTQRFEIRTTNQPYFEAVRDLTCGIFTVLKETPIKMLGINHDIHFALNDKDKYFNFGNKLSPLSNWDGIIKDPRLVNLEIIQNEREDDLKGNIRIRISPSTIIPPMNFGISIDINDHYQLGETKKIGSSEIIKMLQVNWEKSFERANMITSKLWKKIAI